MGQGERLLHKELSKKITPDNLPTIILMVPCSTLLREGTFCSGWKLSQRPTNKKSLSNNFVYLLINGTPSSYVSSESLEIFMENKVEKN